jgi:hypothetical protein
LRRSGQHVADERNDPVELDGRSAWLLDSNGPFFGRRLSQAEMNAMVSASRRADRLTW